MSDRHPIKREYRCTSWWTGFNGHVHECWLQKWHNGPHYCVDGCADGVIDLSQPNGFVPQGGASNV